MKYLITTHYADGRESETREMTAEEISQLPPPKTDETQHDNEIG